MKLAFHTHPDSLPQCFKQNARHLSTAGGGVAEVRDHSCSLQLAHLAVTSPVCFFQLGLRDTSSASLATWGGGGEISADAAWLCCCQCFWMQDGVLMVGFPPQHRAEAAPPCRIHSAEGLSGPLPLPGLAWDLQPTLRG